MISRYFLEVRLQERVFLGIGNKPFMDIQPSEAAINDRAIDYVLMGRGEYLMFLNKSVTFLRPLHSFLLQKTEACSLWDHVPHGTSFQEGGQSPPVQGAALLPPRPLDGAPSPLWGTCVDQSRRWLQGSLDDMHRPEEPWRRTILTMRVEVSIYCVSETLMRVKSMWYIFVTQSPITSQMKRVFLNEPEGKYIPWCTPNLPIAMRVFLMTPEQVYRYQGIVFQASENFLYKLWGQRSEIRAHFLQESQRYFNNKANS